MDELWLALRTCLCPFPPPSLAPLSHHVPPLFFASLCNFPRWFFSAPPFLLSTLLCPTLYPRRPAYKDHISWASMPLGRDKRGVRIFLSCSLLAFQTLAAAASLHPLWEPTCWAAHPHSTRLLQQDSLLLPFQATSREQLPVLLGAGRLTFSVHFLSPACTTVSKPFHQTLQLKKSSLWLNHFERPSVPMQTLTDAPSVPTILDLTLSQGVPLVVCRNRPGNP